MIKDFKFGIIGCGHIGKRHAAVLDAAKYAKVTALCDIEPDKAKELASLYEVKDVFANYQEMLNSGVEVVSICTPHYLHKPMAIDALRAGKEVVVEKPMALSADDAEEMSSLAENLGRKLYVIKQNRFNVPIRLAEEALTTNKLGKVFMVECNVLWNRHQGYYDQ